MVAEVGAVGPCPASRPDGHFSRLLISSESSERDGQPVVRPVEEVHTRHRADALRDGLCCIVPAAEVGEDYRILGWYHLLTADAPQSVDVVCYGLRLHVFSTFHQQLELQIRQPQPAPPIREVTLSIFELAHPWAIAQPVIDGEFPVPHISAEPGIVLDRTSVRDLIQGAQGGAAIAAEGI